MRYNPNGTREKLELRADELRKQIYDLKKQGRACNAQQTKLDQLEAYFKREDAQK